jgi:hypothetical protein
MQALLIIVSVRPETDDNHSNTSKNLVASALSSILKLHSEFVSPSFSDASSIFSSIDSILLFISGFECDQAAFDNWKCVFRLLIQDPSLKKHVVEAIDSYLSTHVAQASRNLDFLVMGYQVEVRSLFLDWS